MHMYEEFSCWQVIIKCQSFCGPRTSKCFGPTLPPSSASVLPIIMAVMGSHGHCCHMLVLHTLNDESCWHLLALKQVRTDLLRCQEWAEESMINTDWLFYLEQYFHVFSISTALVVGCFPWKKFNALLFEANNFWELAGRQCVTSVCPAWRFCRMQTWR